ncbi:MAG: hypothetical protein A3C30_00610 [Candidatus Levybacteria bacterium RIFCSPHIGHO2_02_FULL_40_18]|nr:MAG: hypothetical protein A2869_03320 [Candidatus Levybacteria bacterium RIFCSPHIGHO2_01_FULL_40_58]OGH27202.1 MAG: hypothetical protein A3C30_00610 [Candidatus Levybacteria bacterium RIFCSPHIGHO2_02_FULL_40_18]OGH31061.1 MAG: hypothetical protein A3E43_05025 [Candidatus Levybacteria bacterium RIFCSPHIGHO2_12_FULL_40_31]OGH40771.1 MAG: hypothetical protein A2894_03415 [Candidatus Levybacteria bacterium RIFCSPLOWO2_01_FULL_40_64]OGH49409.1 MAG: hypothetical protein A3I54_02055 [Candidatus Lev
MFRYYLILFLTFLILLFPRNIFAESSYVLPYPSAMPGSIIYKLNLIQEELLRFWYFGDFGQFKYNLSQSDKYLVEAKTLFDYKQYLLAFQDLQKSDKYLKKIEPAILSAKKNGKNTTDKKKLLKEAAEKHIEELLKLKQNLPQTFKWRPEKQQGRTLNLSEAFENSIRVRQEAL